MRSKIFLKRTFIIFIVVIIVIVIIQLLLSLLQLTTIIKLVKTLGAAQKKVFKPGTSVSIFQRCSGYYLLYGHIETYKLLESVYKSFLDAQIKGTKYSF